MKSVYYVNKTPYCTDSLKLAVEKGLKLAKEATDVTTMVIVVSTTSQYSLLAELFSSSEIKNKSCYIPELNLSIRIETVKTYTSHTYNCHIFIPLCVSSKELLKFEDEWNAQYWIVVPWLMSEMESWLKVHSAIDVQTNATIANDYSLEEKVQNGIGWLKATSYPNEGFNHPLDSNRLKCMANAIASCGYEITYDSVLFYCLNNGINHDGGRKIADAFEKAQTRKFKTDGNYPLKFLKEMMNEKHEDI